MGAEDRGYELDIMTGKATELVAVVNRVTLLSPSSKPELPRWQPLPTCSWTVVAPCKSSSGRTIQTFQAKMGKVLPDVQGIARVDAEFVISLPALESKNGQPPGLGIAVVVPGKNATPSNNYSPIPGGSFPETIAKSAVGKGPQDLLPMNYQTIVFDKPVGTQLRLASWNVKRFTTVMHDLEAVLRPEAFDDTQMSVSDELVGWFLADKGDIVAIQEMWDQERGGKIVKAANKRRAELGLRPFGAYGPIDFDKSTLSNYVSLNAVDQTTGGVLILSPFPAIDQSFHVFGEKEKVGEVCLGEDCLKAKGVQWVRLWLGAPPPDCDKNCTANSDLFVDVFNTHLQADTDTCKDQLKTSAVLSLLQTAVTGVEGVTTGVAGLLALNSLNCNSYDTNAEVRALQLKEMASFVESKADSGRPAIIMGDFNIDGGRLNKPFSPDSNPGFTYEYGKMLSTLGISPWGTNVGDNAPSDLINPDPAGFDWDVDHGDLMREVIAVPDIVGPPIDDNSLMDDKRLTYIGAKGGGIQRFDYILLRPPSRVGATGNDAAPPAKYMFAKPSSGSVWQPVWPYSGGPDGYVIPARLSDHKMVQASLELVEFQPPPKYHKTFAHGWELRATSYFINDTDCFLCGDVDGNARFHGYKFVSPPGGMLSTKEFAIGTAGTPCEGQAHADYTPSDPENCINSWAIGDAQNYPNDAQHQGSIGLIENDGALGGPDDEYPTFAAGKNPMMAITWGSGLVTLRDRDNSGIVPDKWVDFYASDNGPFGFCGASGGNTMCVRTTISELPPDQQK